MNKELKEAIYEMNETHYEPLRTTERNKVIKLVEQELSKLDKIQEIINHADEEDTVTYQQRLDKVLEKFETNMKWNSKYYFLTKKGFSIMCNQFNEFYLYWFNSNNRYKISLDTVENLIKDLKSDNE